MIRGRGRGTGGMRDTLSGAVQPGEVGEKV